jgi:acyl carrier protein
MKRIKAIPGTGSATRPEIFKRGVGILKSKIDLDFKLPPDIKIKPSDRFRDDLYLDSMDQYEMGYYLEEEFGVIMNDLKAYECKTVRDVVDYVFELLGGKFVKSQGRGS